MQDAGDRVRTVNEWGDRSYIRVASTIAPRAAATSVMAISSVRRLNRHLPVIAPRSANANRHTNPVTTDVRAVAARTRFGGRSPIIAITIKYPKPVPHITAVQFEMRVSKAANRGGLAFMFPNDNTISGVAGQRPGVRGRR
jgi:hypothetical protein